MWGGEYFAQQTEWFTLLLYVVGCMLINNHVRIVGD